MIAQNWALFPIVTDCLNSVLQWLENQAAMFSYDWKIPHRLFQGLDEL
jgi:hypothetical protein